MRWCFTVTGADHARALAGALASHPTSPLCPLAVRAVKLDKLNSYKQHHDTIWKEVAGGLRRAGIQQLTTWQLPGTNRLVMYITTSGVPDLGPAVGPGSTYREEPRCVEWETLMEQESLFIPKVDDISDLSYFEARQELFSTDQIQVELDDSEATAARFRGFSFINVDHLARANQNQIKL